MPVFKGTIKSKFDDTRKIADKVKGLYVDEDGNKIETMCMVFTELIENIVKYADFEDASNIPIFSIKNNEGVVVITTRNKVKDSQSLERVIEHVKKTKECGDSIDLYTSRLEELAKNGQQEQTGLGLYRIAYEGKFKLDINVEGVVLSIQAQRQFSNDSLEDILENFKEEELEIQLTEGDNNIINMEWLGKSRSLKPGVMLDPYLEGLVNKLIDKELICNFSNLEYMNSSTVSSIVTFAQLLNKKSIKTIVAYSNEKEWQEALFEAFKIIALGLKNVTLKNE